MIRLVPALLTGAAVAVALGPRAGPLRLALLLPRPPASPPPPATRAPAVPARREPRSPHAGRRTGADHHGTAPGTGSPHAGRRPPLLGCLVVAAALVVVVGGPTGIVIAAVVVMAGPRLLAVLDAAGAGRTERARAAQDLPLALDLLAACLSGGAALPAAVRAVADAVPGPCGERLGRVAAALDVGSSPADAWAQLVEERDELSGAAARALARTGHGGAPVAAAVARLASQAREQARARGETAAERAGVLAVAPLGLCFLPAFVLIGVVPVIAGLVGPLLASL